MTQTELRMAFDPDRWECPCAPLACNTYRLFPRLDFEYKITYYCEFADKTILPPQDFIQHYLYHPSIWFNNELDDCDDDVSFAEQIIEAYTEDNG